MLSNDSNSKITIFDTTLRDGELTLGVELTIRQKLQLAELLEAMRVDVIEVGYPGAFPKDFDALLMVSKQIKQAAICGLASTKPDDIIDVALAINPAARGRIHVYMPMHPQAIQHLTAEDNLSLIRDSLKLARNYRDDIEWSAFNALNSDPNFLCRSIETAIRSGATTINIPDTLGDATPETFLALIRMISNRVPNIDQATISVHCHNDRGLALTNSILALSNGVRQIKCAINGLGARKGNADLAAVVRAIAKHGDYCTNVNPDLLDQASELVTQMTGIKPAPSQHWLAH